MLKTGITTEEIQKIFRNRDNKTRYLQRVSGADDDLPRSNSGIDELIIETWDYNASKDIIRSLFKDTEKYIYGESCREKINVALEEWRRLDLGEIAWPFSAMGFDQHVHQINRNESLSEEEKDSIIAKQSIAFRRIKNINALRNDYIEHLIIGNDNVIPTFGNSKGVDFYIDGNPYDQKVAKGVGSAFQNKYGESYRETAIMHPELVAKSLYENQDEARFGAEPRLLIVYLDSDVTVEQMERQLEDIDFNTPYHIEFDYTHSNSSVLHHETDCFIILLHN